MQCDLSNRRLCLVLEDNWMIASGLQNQLEKQGFEEVVVCQTCSEATRFLDRIGPEVPDLAVLDVSLADDETSLTVAQKLRQFGARFIFVSGYGAANDVAAEFPDAETLQKPVFNDQLSTALDRILGSKAPA